MSLPAKPRNYLLYAAIIVVSLLILFSHRPDALLNPQFWAEDSKFSYAQAYNLGAWKSLLIPCAGCYQILSRAVASFCQLLPFAWAPAIFALVAMSIVLVTAGFIASDRLALLCCLVLVAPRAGRAGVESLRSCRDDPRRFFRAVLPAPAAGGGDAVLVVASVVQAACLLSSDHLGSVPLGASVARFLKIAAGHWFIGPVVSDWGYIWLIRQGFLKCRHRFNRPSGWATSPRGKSCGCLCSMSGTG